MSIIQNQVFTEQAIEVDGNRYEGCLFSNCRLVYNGGDLPTFLDCEFQGVTIQLEDGAFQTVQYLKGLYPHITSSVEETLEVVEFGKPKEVEIIDRELALATGTNYGQMAYLSLIAIVITILLIVGLWYGMVIAPQDTLENNEPLSYEIPVEVMPALPAELGDEYDAMRVEQKARLNTYSWVDEENGIGTIPLEDALNLVLEEGLPTWSGSEGE